MKQLAELDATTKRIQCDVAAVCSTQAQFDAVLETYPAFSDCLDSDAQDIHDSHSESAISKIQEEEVWLLNVSKEKQVSGLHLDLEVSREGDIVDDSII